jgi:hypothetical protein
MNEILDSQPDSNGMINRLILLNAYLESIRALSVHCVQQSMQVCLVYVTSKSPVFCPVEKR